MLLFQFLLLVVACCAVQGSPIADIDILSPPNGGTFVIGREEVILRANAQLSDGSIPTLLLYLNGQESARVESESVNTIAKEMPRGAHEFSVAVASPLTKEKKSPVLIAIQSVRFGVVNEEEWAAALSVDDPGCPYSEDELFSQYDDILSSFQKKFSSPSTSSSAASETISRLSSLIVNVRGREDRFTAKIYLALARLFILEGKWESAVLCLMDSIRCDASWFVSHSLVADLLRLGGGGGEESVLGGTAAVRQRNAREALRYKQTASRLRAGRVVRGDSSISSGDSDSRSSSRDNLHAVDMEIEDDTLRWLDDEKIKSNNDQKNNNENRVQQSSSSGSTHLLSHFTSGNSVPRPVVALATSATGKYARYVPALIATAEENFLRFCCEVHYFVFTDTMVNTSFPSISQVEKEGRLHILPKEDEGWPYGSLMRIHSYHEHFSAFEKQNVQYIYATDVDVAFAEPIGSEIFGDKIGTMHPDNLFYDGTEIVGHVERAAKMGGLEARGMMYRQNGGGLPIVTRAVYDRTDSTANIPPTEGKQYYAGGFYGCSIAKCPLLFSFLVNQTNADEEEGALAMFHDESHLNKFFSLYPADRVLSPGFIYPEPNFMADAFCYPGPSCARDEMHPWLFTPWRPSELVNKIEGETNYDPWFPGRWGGKRKFSRRILNLTSGGMTLKRSGEVAS